MKCLEQADVQAGRLVVALCCLGGYGERLLLSSTEFLLEVMKMSSSYVTVQANVMVCKLYLSEGI